MNQDLWKMIVSINNLLSPLRTADAQSSVAAIDLMQLRSKMRDQLVDLRTAITEQYSERDAYYVLFPLTAHCDEVIKKMNHDGLQQAWPPLQQEFYQVDDAGDLFYELLDNTLSKPETLGLVYEVYYFCLSDGFSGRYSGNPGMAASYLDKLRKHIGLQPLPVTPESASKARRRAYFRIPTYSHYIVNVVLFILNYWLLTFMASTWQP
ncbi:MAG: DotU family type IV/VI secretion system protein [Methylobacter sp.]